VIEVGVDVPNASVMLIEEAGRFGLSQLHQLRGRIGRGSAKSWCILLQDGAKGDALEKLQALERTADGFEIAEVDLRLRGPGDMLGTAQSGLPALGPGDLLRDAEEMSEARAAAKRVLERDPGLDLPEHAALRRHVDAQRDRKILAEG
jgi:ATP-dependent DNA helicase RecG